MSDYDQSLEELRKSLDDRLKKNDALRERTFLAIESSLAVAEACLKQEIAEAEQRGKEQQRTAAVASLAELPERRNKQRAFEDNRYAAEQAIVASEQKRIDDLARDHLQERLALENRHASERVTELEKQAAIEKSRDIDKDRSQIAPPEFDPVHRAIELASNAYIVVQESYLHVPVIEPDMADKLAEYAKVTYDHLKVVAPEPIREMLPKTPGEIDQLAKDQIEQDREHPSKENEGQAEIDKDRKETLERQLAEQERKELEALRAEQLRDLADKLLEQQRLKETRER
jgi:hypothetical protein